MDTKIKGNKSKGYIEIDIFLIINEEKKYCVIIYMYKGPLKGVIFYLVGGQILPYYYKYYSHSLRFFGLNPKTVFESLSQQTKNNSRWNGNKITVKLDISNGKITDTKIALYPSIPK